MAKTIEIKVPSPGESITEAELAAWLVDDGAYVTKDQEVAEIESDKATLPLIAAESGQISIKIQEGETVAVGATACTIDTSVPVPEESEEASPETADDTASKGKDEPAERSASGPSESASAGSGTADTSAAEQSEAKTGKKASGAAETGKTDPVASKTGSSDPKASGPRASDTGRVKVSPVAARMMEENGLSVEDVIGGLKRIGRKEVEMVLGQSDAAVPDPPEASREVERKRLSSLRRKMSERLIAVKNETAMLTTFNECDMSEVIRLRKQYQKPFTEKHGVKLGFMSFFVKAVTVALRAYPNVNAQIDGEEMVRPAYCDVGIAVQTDKGLMVPVLRNTEAMSMAEIETGILELAGKARAARISLEEMSGGTFTITNGGVYGSMMSTPILNPPQSAILGMHNITERPMAIGGKVVIRPMMYLALSYDHRMIDGRDSVSFLVRVKELIENPTGMLFGGNDPEQLLLDL